MVKTTNRIIPVKASAAKPLGKPQPGDKPMGVDPKILLYTLEDGDETTEGEEEYILVVHNSSLAVYKQNLVKSKFPYIDIFYHEGPAVVNAMPDLTSGVFDNLYITSPMYVYQRVACTQRILRGSALKN